MCCGVVWRSEPDARALLKATPSPLKTCRPSQLPPAVLAKHAAETEPPVAARRMPQRNAASLLLALLLPPLAGTARAQLTGTAGTRITAPGGLGATSLGCFHDSCGGVTRPTICA